MLSKIVLSVSWFQYSLFEENPGRRTGIFASWQ